MQRSSETIGALAAALAKAQVELANPEKSLTAIIHSPFPRESSQSFRYASLASGLDIVRKSLGRQEIATVQSTSIDHAAGLIRLTTTLAHSSGEWVASDWPVCPISEIAAAHRMGTALTYARRYALFALVGIAGDDDLDAPDLHPAVGPDSEAAKANPDVNGEEPLMRSSRERRLPNRVVSGAKARRSAPVIRLSPAQSNGLREKLIAELSMQTSTQLADWAKRGLPVKNTLTAEDAKEVERAFTARLEASAPDPAELTGADGSFRNLADVSPAALIVGRVSQVLDDERANPGTGQIDKSVLAISEPKRYRHKAHLKFVASRPCMLCGREPSDPHHLRFAQARALGRKVSDEYVVPLCRSHHRELHRGGNEKRWWSTIGIDPLPAAAELWAQSRSLSPDRDASDVPVRASTPPGQSSETKPIDAGPSQ